MSSFMRDGTGITGYQGVGLTPGNSAWTPSGWKYETHDRHYNTGIAGVLVSGVVRVEAIWLPENITISKLGFITGGVAMSAVTHSWMCLMDGVFSVLGVSPDNSFSPAITTTGTLISATFGAQASTNYTGLHYAALMVAGTVNTATTEGFTSDTNTTGIPPVLCGNSSGSQTTPPAVGATLAAITGGNSHIYMVAA